MNSVFIGCHVYLFLFHCPIFKYLHSLLTSYPKYWLVDAWFFSFSHILFLILLYVSCILLFHNFCNLFGIREYCRYRISLFSRWKQRGMYATCMWVVELLLVLSNSDTCFCYVPEFYLESLVNTFFVIYL